MHVTPGAGESLGWGNPAPRCALWAPSEGLRDHQGRGDLTCPQGPSLPSPLYPLPLVQTGWGTSLSWKGPLCDPPPPPEAVILPHPQAMASDPPGLPCSWVSRDGKEGDPVPGGEMSPTLPECQLQDLAGHPASWNTVRSSHPSSSPASCFYHLPSHALQVRHGPRECRSQESDGAGTSTAAF